MNRAVFAALCCTLLGSSACSNGDRPDVASVSGHVTLDGKPLDNAWVTFHPDYGRPSGAKTDEGGKYELLYLREVKGAKIGHHKVTISTLVDPVETADGSLPARERVPAIYNVKTSLEANVQEGDNTIDFTLESSRK